MNEPIFDAIRIEVEHAGGVETFTPNTILMEMFQKEDQEERWLPLEDALSDISGGPCIVYRSDEVTVHMTVAELRRMVCKSLRPEEFKALHAKHGSFFEIHDDFYDPSTGEAFQELE